MASAGDSDKLKFDLGDRRKTRNLTMEEQVVWGLIAKGITQSRICIDMDLPFREVRVLVHSLYKKLEVHNRAEATAAYYREQEEVMKRHLGSHWNAPADTREGLDTRDEW